MPRSLEAAEILQCVLLGDPAPAGQLLQLGDAAPERPGRLVDRRRIGFGNRRGACGIEAVELRITVWVEKTTRNERRRLGHARIIAAIGSRGESVPVYRASWKITPSVWRCPERNRLTPWRMVTR